MALKLKYEFESNSWHRYPHLVSWREADAKRQLTDPNENLVGEMAAFLRHSNIDHSRLMLNDAYNMHTYQMPVKIMSGFRFLNENEAMIFWLKFQGNE
jgi:hypothetical protein